MEAAALSCLGPSHADTMDRRTRALPKLNPLAVFAAWTLVAVLLFLYRWLDDLTRGHTGMMGLRLLEETTGAYTAMLLFPLLVWFVRRFPIDKTNWARLAPLYVLAMVLLSVTHTSMMALSRAAIAPLVGLGPYDYGDMRVRYWMEMANDALSFCVMTGLINLFDYYATTRDHEVRAAQLESRLAQAQLQNLRLQLQPHFLFNALNTVSAVMYDDPRRADRMLADLSELLRMTLRNTQAQETTLDEELRFLGHYVEIMQARFEERLQVEVEADPVVRGALVPQLLLQPLVENAIRHGFDPVTSRGTIEVRCARENGTLVLTVRDHGTGLKEPAAQALQHGIGLSNTAARLTQLYGERHQLDLVNPAGGGLEVRIRLPYRSG